MTLTFRTDRTSDAAISGRHTIYKQKPALFSKPYATFASQLSLCYDALLVRHPCLTKSQAPNYKIF